MRLVIEKIKKHKFLLITLIILTFIIVSYQVYRAVVNLPKVQIKIRYGVSIPIDAKLVYRYETPPSFFGDGTEYWVFEFKKEPTQIISKMTSKNCKSQTAYDEDKDRLLKYFETAITFAKEIDKNYLPDYEKYFEWSYYCNALGGMNALYFPDSNTMYIFRYTT